jgi:endonuclease/exonuclease/phosphatase family metal-dependent hydrolase
MAYVGCSINRPVRFLTRLLVVLVSLFSAASVASAQTVTLDVPGTHINADLTIQDGSAAYTDFSNADSIATKVSYSGYTRRIFLKFDTQNYVPAGATIQSAYLYLTLKKAESSENRPLTAYWVNRSFVRWETNWYYYRNGQPWSNPGGDLGSSFGTTYVSNAVGTAYQFDVTQLVQAAVRGDFGTRYTRLALVDTGANNGGNFREFHSTRAANGSQRPRLVITYGSSPTPPPAPPPPPPPSGSTLRVMQWNIKKTKGSDGRCDPDRIATVIASQNVHVASLNEVNFYSGECAWTFDMGERLRSLVQQRTGVTWYKHHVNVYGGTNGYGNVLLSQYPLVSTNSTLLSYSRGVAQIGINVNGRTVNLFSTHVEYYNASWRPIQIYEAVSWLWNFSEPRIMMGDFNTWPNTSDYYLAANYYWDAWSVGQGNGTAWSYNGTGATHGSSRFDYVFYLGSSLSLQSVNVPDSRIGGVYPSDHDPVIAVFNVY